MSSQSSRTLNDRNTSLPTSLIRSLLVVSLTGSVRWPKSTSIKRTAVNHQASLPIRIETRGVVPLHKIYAEIRIQGQRDHQIHTSLRTKEIITNCTVKPRMETRIGKVEASVARTETILRTIIADQAGIIILEIITLTSPRKLITVLLRLLITRTSRPMEDRIRTE